MADLNLSDTWFLSEIANILCLNFRQKMFMLNKFFIFLITFAFISGCATQIKTLQDPKADFSSYKTFCWINRCDFTTSGPSYLNDSLVMENIKKSIISELNMKGLSLDTDSPDLLVSFNITIENQQTISYPRHDDDTFFHPIDNKERIINFLEGTMVIGIADNKESRVVWESFASRYMESEPDLSEKNIAHGIHLILKKFPNNKQSVPKP